MNMVRVRQQTGKLYRLFLLLCLKKSWGKVNTTHHCILILAMEQTLSPMWRVE